MTGQMVNPLRDSIPEEKMRTNGTSPIITAYSREANRRVVKKITILKDPIPQTRSIS